MLGQICTNTNSEEGPHENNSFTYISIPDGCWNCLCGSKVLGVKYILNQSKYESIISDTTCYRS